MVDVIHVHEDVWGMRNLYPITVRAEVDKDIADSVEAEKRNRDPSGIGYVDMYEIKPPSQNYSDHKLTLEALERVLSPIFPRVRQFNATISSVMHSDKRDPYGSYEGDAWCFGTGPDCFVKIDAKGDLAGSIWFDLDPNDPQAVILIRKAIIAIDSLVKSVIADYYIDFSGPVSEVEQLDRYFEALA